MTILKEDTSCSKASLHIDGLTGQGSQGGSGWGLGDLGEYTAKLDVHLPSGEWGKPANLNPRPLSLLKNVVNLILKVIGSEKQTLPEALTLPKQPRKLRMPFHLSRIPGPGWLFGGWWEGVLERMNEA